MRFHFAPLLALSLLSACAVTPNEGDVASSAEPITGGVASTSQTVVFISVWRNNVPYTCNGTLISPTYVLTTQGCVDTTDTAANVVVQTVPHPPSTSNVSKIVSVATPGTAVFGVLLQLTTPITRASYPAISRTPLALGASMTCASTNPTGAYDGPVEAPFVVAEAFHPTVGYWGVSPTNGASFVTDHGDGCFQGNTMVALEGYPEGGTYKAAIQDVSFLAPSIDAVFCGSRKCGTVQEGSTTISCGTCGDGDKCLAGSCVSALTCPIGKVNCDGICMLAKYCW